MTAPRAGRAATPLVYLGLFRIILPSAATLLGEPFFSRENPQAFPACGALDVGERDGGRGEVLGEGWRGEGHG